MHFFTIPCYLFPDHPHVVMYISIPSLRINLYHFETRSLKKNLQIIWGEIE